MRQTFSLVFLLMAIALAMCAYLALRSRKAIGKHVAQTVAALIPPVIGNMIIIGSGTKASSTLGCYIYFLGMDLVMLALTGFTLEYCHLPNLKAKYLTTVRALLAVDAVQLLLNPLFGHAFDTEAIPVDGFAYYRLVPRLGQTFHRVVDYGILATVIVIFIYKLIRTPRIYAERYGIILAAILVGLVWETYYIFSRTPIDRSMVSFGVFGLLVFYFSIYYRPVRLLDRMLANIASEMPEAMFFLDVTGHCVWANRPGQQLAEIRARVDEVLELFGLTPSRSHLVEKLSGGQKKRVSIAMELISNPSLFILDEPDSGLDGTMARELMEQLRRIADRGKIVIVITHTPDRVIDLFDDVIVLAKDDKRVGRLAYYGSVDGARSFFGKERMEEIVKSINSADAGGEGRAEEFIAKYAELAEVQHA